MMDVIGAFNEYKKTFLEGKKSIFTDTEEVILTQEAINFLRNNFIQNGNPSNEAFIGKLKQQLLDNSKQPNQSIISQSIQVLAHAVWLWRLPPHNATPQGRLKAVNEVLSLANLKITSEKGDNSSYVKWFESVEAGFASTGTYYNTNKPFELAYLIEFFAKYLENLEAVEDFVYSDTDSQSIIESNGIKTQKSVAIKNALMYLMNPEEHEPILSYAHKKAIVEAFAYLLPESEQSEHHSAKIKKIKNKLKGIIYLSDEEKNLPHFFYLHSVRILWDKQMAPIETNTIYYGAPGTGKTYLTFQAVKALVSFQTKIDNVEEEISNRIEQVQFHPGFGYEDFIDGLKPQVDYNGSIALALTNGIFKEFCIKATKALMEYRKKPKNPIEIPPNEKFYFIVDEINRAELSAVFGEILSCIEEDKRLDFDVNGSLVKGLAIRSQNAYLINDKKDAVYTDSYGRHLFGIPKNLVFIGTMNDIDRSVDTFDFALRRRFTWIHKGFDSDVLGSCKELSALDFSEVQDYIASCKALNRYISEDLGLGRSFEIGHAYFMKVGVHGGSVQKEKLFSQRLAPLIEEYLRSEYSARDIEAKVKEAKGKFVDDKAPKKSKNNAD